MEVHEAKAFLAVAEELHFGRAADRLGISRQAIDQALHAAGYPALHDALTLLETSE